MAVARPLLLLAALSLLSSCGLSAPERSTAPGKRVVTAPIAPSAAARQCFANLTAAKVRYSPLPNRRFSGGCTQIDSISLLDVGAQVTNLGPVKCELAEKFAAWTEYAAKRAARRYLGGELARIETFGSYSCRNIAGSRRLSQHAHANAIDVSAFVLADGRRITVLDGWYGSAEERLFLKRLHESACRRFGTVLGPDYNAAHRNHFHFDMSGRGFCR